MPLDSSTRIAPSPSGSAEPEPPTAETAACEKMQTFRTSELAAAASGRIDLNALARRELAQRGLDQSGAWVGFDKAAAALASAEKSAGARRARRTLGSGEGPAR